MGFIFYKKSSNSQFMFKNKFSPTMVTLFSQTARAIIMMQAILLKKGKNKPDEKLRPTSTLRLN